jgi:hypothetical protein
MAIADHYLIRNHNGSYYNRICCTFQERLYATRMAKSVAMAEVKYLKDKGLTVTAVHVKVKGKS